MSNSILIVIPNSIPITTSTKFKMKMWFIYKGTILIAQPEMFGNLFEMKNKFK